jgi:hypothetical protein
VFPLHFTVMDCHMTMLSDLCNIVKLCMPLLPHLVLQWQLFFAQVLCTFAHISLSKLSWTVIWQFSGQHAPLTAVGNSTESCWKFHGKATLHCISYAEWVWMHFTVMDCHMTITVMHADTTPSSLTWLNFCESRPHFTVVTVMDCHPTILWQA